MSAPHRKPWRIAAAALASAAVVGIVFLAAYFLLGASRGELMNPYEYNLDAFLEVPAELMLYSEGDSLDVALKAPKAIAVDAADRIYVAGDSTVVVFEKAGNVVRNIKLAEPANCIDVGEDSTLFVGLKDHVEVYDPSGSRRAVWPSLGELAFLTAVAAGARDVFVADFTSRLVWRFDTSGRLLDQIGRRDGAGGTSRFILPSPYFDLALAADGALWVVNPGKQRVENHTYDGEFKGAWGTASMAIEGFCGCCNPTHIAIAPNGSFVTSEKGLPRVKIYGPGGEFEGVVAAPRQFAEGTVGLDLAVDSAGRVLVLDPEASAVRVFTRRTGGAAAEGK